MLLTQLSFRGGYMHKGTHYAEFILVEVLGSPEFLSLYVNKNRHLL